MKICYPEKRNCCLFNFLLRASFFVELNLSLDKIFVGHNFSLDKILSPLRFFYSFMKEFFIIFWRCPCFPWLTLKRFVFSLFLNPYLPVCSFSFKFCLIRSLMWLLLVTFFILPFSCTDKYFKDTRRKKIKAFLVRHVVIIVFDVHAKQLMRLFQQCKLRAHRDDDHRDDGHFG